MHLLEGRATLVPLDCYLVPVVAPARPSSTIEFIDEYYHVERPHQGPGGETPVPHETPDFSGPTELVSIPVRGGPHHRYVRVAA